MLKYDPMSSTFYLSIILSDAGYLWASQWWFIKPGHVSHRAAQVYYLRRQSAPAEVLVGRSNSTRAQSRPPPVGWFFTRHVDDCRSGVFLTDRFLHHVFGPMMAPLHCGKRSLLNKQTGSCDWSVGQEDDDDDDVWVSESWDFLPEGRVSSQAEQENMEYGWAGWHTHHTHTHTHTHKGGGLGWAGSGGLRGF